MEIELTDANFEQEVLKSDLPILVDFWATWCGPCQVISPLIAEIAEEYEGKVKVCKLNVDEAPVIASKYGIMSIPTLMVFKDGKSVDAVVGVVSKDEIKNVLNEYI